MMNGPDILKRILDTKLEEVAADRAEVSQQELIHRVIDMPACRRFYQSIQTKVDQGLSAIIAEAKKASPSKGVIRENFDVVEIAKSYQQGGATCLSILTDKQYFKGNLSYLAKVKPICKLPILRKDFIIDEYQVYQSRAAGADCILLIVAALDKSKLNELTQCAHETDLDVLVEVHDNRELEQALSLNSVLVGINNRNLQTFETHLATTLDLLENIPSDRLVVTESGINSQQDIELMHDHGVFAFLIGEAFMRAKSPGAKLKALFGES